MGCRDPVNRLRRRSARRVREEAITTASRSIQRLPSDFCFAIIPSAMNGGGGYRVVRFNRAEI